MPFVDLNSFQTGNSALPGAAPSTGVLPPQPGTPAALPRQAMDSQDTNLEPTEFVTNTIEPIEEVDTPVIEAVVPEPVAEYAPAAIPEMPVSPAVMEIPVPQMPPLAQPVATEVIPEPAMSQAVSEVPVEPIAENTASTTTGNAYLPVESTPLMEVAPVSDNALVDDPVAITEPQVLSFTSTADTEDPDKASAVISQNVAVTEGVEVKADEKGIRVINGPDFDTGSQISPAETIATQSMDEKLAALGGLKEIESSTPQQLIVPMEVENTPSETIVAEIPALPIIETAIVPQPQATQVAEPVAIPEVAAVVPVQLAPLQSQNSMLEEYLNEAMTMGASDLHLTAGYRPMVRVDGKLVNLSRPVLDADTIASMLVDVVKARGVADVRELRDFDLAYRMSTSNARFRINIFKQQGGTAAVLRLIPTQILSIEALKLPSIVREFTKFSQGLVLVTGPTGSGKSTTIASILNQINMNEPKHIVTIEDPVEYVYPKGIALVDQREIYSDTDSWGDALRSALREDPDVVLVGEMRDLETITSAIRVAETGHLVFATLHTNSAAQSIDRIIDVFPEGQQSQIRTQLASVLMAVLSQRLIPVSGGGRRAAAELLLATPAVRNAIRDDKVYQIDNMIQTGGELGMVTMEKSLVGLVREGLVSTEIAQEYSNKPADILTLLGQNR